MIIGYKWLQHTNSICNAHEFFCACSYSFLHSVYQLSGSAKIHGQDSTSTEQSVTFLRLQVHLSLGTW